MASQEQLKKFRDIISKRPQEERIEFIKKFQSLSSEKKDIAIFRIIENKSKLIGNQKQQVNPENLSQNQIKNLQLLGNLLEKAYKPIQGIKTTPQTEQKVEQKIQERPSAMESLREEVMTPYEGNIAKRTLKAGITGLKTLAVPYERGAAAIANPLLELQKSPDTRRSLWDVAVEGLKGERRGQFGDLYRQVGFPEPLAGFLGLINFGLVADMATKGHVKRAAESASKFVKDRFPKRMNKDFVLGKAKQATNALDELYNGLSKQYDDLFSKIGNKKVNEQLVSEALEELPENVIKKIAKSKLVRRSAKTGDIVNDVQNLKEIRTIIRRSIPERIWNGRALGNPDTASMEQVYGKLSSIMAQGNDDLVNLNRNYSGFMKTRKAVGRVLWDSDGNVVEKPLMQLFSKSGDRGKQVVFENFAKQFPQGNQIIKDVLAYNRRQALKSIIKKAGAAVAIGGIGGAVGGSLARKGLISR